MADRTTTTRRGLLAGAAVALAGARSGRGQATDPDYTPIFENPDPISSPPDGGEVELPIIANPVPPDGGGGGLVLARAVAAATAQKPVRIDFEVEQLSPGQSLAPRHGHVMAEHDAASGRLRGVIRLRKKGTGDSLIRAYIKNPGNTRWSTPKRVLVQR